MDDKHAMSSLLASLAHNLTLHSLCFYFHFQTSHWVACLRSWFRHFLHCSYICCCYSVYQTGASSYCSMGYLPGRQTPRWALLLRWRGTLDHQDAASRPRSQRTSGRTTIRKNKKTPKEKGGEKGFYLVSLQPAAVHIHGLTVSNPLLYAAVGKFAHWQPQMAARAKWSRTFQFTLSGNIVLSVPGGAGGGKKVQAVWISLCDAAAASEPLLDSALKHEATQWDRRRK